MSLRLGMLQVARRAPRLLNNSADLVRRFLRGQLNTDGSFPNRSGQSDLYYTVFGLDALVALEVPLPLASIARYLAGFQSGEGLDLVHLACLARGWATVRDEAQRQKASSPALPPTLPDLPWQKQLTVRIESYRTADGGFAVTGRHQGSAYGAFLALGAYEDLAGELARQDAVIRSLSRLKCRGGGWANESSTSAGTVPATASAIMVLSQFQVPPADEDLEWLWQNRHPRGGFRATPTAPLPDLLSTAVALHAWSTARRDLGPFREVCLDYVDSLWTNAGSFHGHWAEDQLDCEYTFYGLLALGHLV